MWIGRGGTKVSVMGSLKQFSSVPVLALQVCRCLTARVCVSGQLHTYSCVIVFTSPPPRQNFSRKATFCLTRNGPHAFIFFTEVARKSPPPASSGTSLSKTRFHLRGSCRAVVYNFNQRVNSVSAVTRNRQSLVAHPPPTNWLDSALL